MINIPTQGKYVAHCFYWEYGTKRSWKLKFDILCSTEFWEQHNTKSISCSRFMGRLTDWQPGRKQGCFFTSRNIGRKQEHTVHNNYKCNQLKYSTLWFISFINDEKYRAVITIIPISGGEAKAEMWLAAVNQWQIGMHNPVIWCHKKNNSRSTRKCMETPVSLTGTHLHFRTALSPQWSMQIRPHTLLWADPSGQRPTKIVSRNMLMTSFALVLFLTPSWLTEDVRFAVTWLCMLCWFTFHTAWRIKHSQFRDLPKEKLPTVPSS